MANTSKIGVRNQAPSSPGMRPDDGDGPAVRSPNKVFDDVAATVMSSKGAAYLTPFAAEIGGCMDAPVSSAEQWDARATFAAGMLMADWASCVAEKSSAGGGRGVGFGIEAAALRAKLVANADRAQLEAVAQGQAAIFDVEVVPMSRQAGMAHGALASMGVVDSERIEDGAFKFGSASGHQITLLQGFAASSRGLAV